MQEKNIASQLSMHRVSSLLLFSQNTIQVLPYKIYMVLGLESRNYLTHMGRICIGYTEIVFTTSVEFGHALNCQHSFLIECESWK